MNIDACCKVDTAVKPRYDKAKDRFHTLAVQISRARMK